MNQSLYRVALLSTLTLAACGGSGGDKAPAPPAIYSVSATVTGLPDGGQLRLAVDAAEPETVSADGELTLQQKLADTHVYKVHVVQQPEGSWCTVQRGIGQVMAAHVSGVEVRCSNDAAAPLFDTNRLQRLRLTISVDDWNAFVLNTARSFYDRNAYGGTSWTLASVSEIYRRGHLEYLSDSGAVLGTVPDVAFRMRGNTSRVWPEDWVFNDASSSWEGRPRRFHINLKFDEDFSDDESVYGCVNDGGQPAAINNEPCMNLLAGDIPEVAANKDRTFMGLESFALKYNKDDPTHVREVLSHAVLNEQGVPAGRAAHAALELVITPGVNASTLFGRPLPQTWQMGVYAVLEPVDKRLVQRLYGKNNYVFKVGGGDLTRGDSAGCVPFEGGGHAYVNPDFCIMGVEQIDPVSRAEWLGEVAASNPALVNSAINRGGQASRFAPYTPTYDLKTKKSDIVLARAALNQFIALINKESTTAADLETVFDVDGFIRAQAVDIAVGAVDHYARVANNYYLYQHPVSKKWIYIPYDYDFSFRDGHIAAWPLNPPFRDVISSTILQGPAAWRNNRIAGVNPRLYDLVFADPLNQQKLLAEVRSVRRNWFNWQARTGPLVSTWLDQLEPAIRATRAGQPGSGDTEYRRAAATGDSYTYRSWVNASNPLASQFAPDQEHSAIPSSDTLKRFVLRRSAVLAAELDAE